MSQVVGSKLLGFQKEGVLITNIKCMDQQSLQTFLMIEFIKCYDNIFQRADLTLILLNLQVSCFIAAAFCWKQCRENDLKTYLSFDDFQKVLYV